MLHKLKKALADAQTGQGSYGPNYDGNMLAASIQGLIAQLSSSAQEQAGTEPDMDNVGRGLEGLPQPYAGAVVLLETIAQCGAIAFDETGAPTPNRELCLRFAGELRVAGNKQGSPTYQD